ncbi:MAG TPA: MBL fold metallo-hydrolase [Saprospiraceae bacterium]|nr:MBL fold metallo-hydrolase [Saprospiraceae bacterium]
MARIKQSPNFRDGAFQNQSVTPQLTDGATYGKVMKEFLFGRPKRATPSSDIPSMKTDLLSLNRDENILVWFGHSSYFMQIDGKRILVDPVLSGSASPFSFMTKAFKGADRYSTDDLPAIDYLFLSHDHYDHLDYKTIVKLKPKVHKIICGLGTGEHLEYWGYDHERIIEKDWNESFELDHGFTVHTVPSRHFSGRWLKRNQALWTSFVLQTPGLRIFIGGDSGYDKHFAEIGNTFGGFDLAIMENGQYNKNWKHIHLMPHEILQAAKELKAKRIFPVHSSKFVLGNHAWDAPLELITENNKKENLNIITPMIGEKVDLDNHDQAFSHWWKGVS